MNPLEINVGLAIGINAKPTYIATVKSFFGAPNASASAGSLEKAVGKLTIGLTDLGYCVTKVNHIEY